MKNYKKVFQLIETLLEKNIFKKLSEGKVLGVEMPDTKTKYYATVIPDLTMEPGLMIFEGQKGLSNLKDLFDDNLEPFDMIPKLNFLGVFFEKDKDFLTVLDEKLQSHNPYGDYDGLGFPRLFRKEAGALEKALLPKDLKIIITVLEQLVEDSLRKLQCIEGFNEDTRISIRKKLTDTWKRYIEKVSFNYQGIRVNEMQVYPIKKKSTKVFQTWHIGLLYHMEPVVKSKDDPELIYPRGIFLLNSDDSLLNHSIHEGLESPITAMKDLIEETIIESKRRPITLVTDNEEVFYALRNYLKALDIKLVFDADDEVLFDFKAFNYEDFESEEVLDLGMEDLFYTFLESKGVLPEAFSTLNQKKIDEIMSEFQEVMKDITETLEHSIQGGKVIPKGEHKGLIKDHLLEGLFEEENNNKEE